MGSLTSSTTLTSSPTSNRLGQLMLRPRERLPGDPGSMRWSMLGVPGMSSRCVEGVCVMVVGLMLWPIYELFHFFLRVLYIKRFQPLIRKTKIVKYVQRQCRVQTALQTVQSADYCSSVWHCVDCAHSHCTVSIKVWPPP